MGLATRAEFDAATRRDSNIFIERVFAELNSATPYLDNFHIAIIAEKLERVRRGEITRLIINVPPRSLKSLIASIAFPALVLGGDPTKKLLIPDGLWWAQAEGVDRRAEATVPTGRIERTTI